VRTVSNNCMKNNITIFGIIITLFFCSCNTPKDIEEDEIYSILNGIIADDSLYVGSICSEFVHLYLTDETKKDFSENDIKFINRQIENYKEYRIKPNILKCYICSTIKNKKQTFVPIIPNCGESTSTFSFPLISIDRKKVLMEISVLSTTGIYLFIFQNGHWKKTITHIYIIS
jgi:hypothetical protein